MTKRTIHSKVIYIYATPTKILKVLCEALYQIFLYSLKPRTPSSGKELGASPTWPPLIRFHIYHVGEIP